MKILYGLYDARARIDLDSAICYTVEDSLEEAKETQEEDFPDAVIVRMYTDKNNIITKQEVIL